MSSRIVATSNPEQFLIFCLLFIEKRYAGEEAGMLTKIRRWHKGKNRAFPLLPSFHFSTKCVIFCENLRWIWLMFHCNYGKEVGIVSIFCEIFHLSDKFFMWKCRFNPKINSLIIYSVGVETSCSTRFTW